MLYLSYTLHSLCSPRLAAGVTFEPVPRQVSVAHRGEFAVRAVKVRTHEGYHVDAWIDKNGRRTIQTFCNIWPPCWPSKGTARSAADNWSPDNVHNCGTVEFGSGCECGRDVRDHDVEGTPIVGQGDHLADFGMGVRTVVSIIYMEKAKALPRQPMFQFPYHVSGLNVFPHS